MQAPIVFMALRLETHKGKIAVTVSSDDRQSRVYLEPGKPTQQSEDNLLVGGFEPDALQLAHGWLQERIDLHYCHGMLKTV